MVALRREQDLLDLHGQPRNVVYDGQVDAHVFKLCVRTELDISDDRSPDPGECESHSRGERGAKVLAWREGLAGIDS